MIRILLTIASCIFALSGTVIANPEGAPNIKLVGLFGSKAVITVDSKRYVLAIGDSTDEGVKLIDTNHEYALIEYNDVSTEYRIGSAPIGTSYSEVKKTAVQVYKDQYGMYRTVGTINSYPVKFLVDTGATTIAMNMNEARRLGINYLVVGEPIVASTASGVTKAYSLMLDTVSVGSIKLRNVRAIVIDGNSPPEVLLGMSFLGRLNVQHKGSVMKLETQF